MTAACSASTAPRTRLIAVGGQGPKSHPCQGTGGYHGRASRILRSPCARIPGVALPSRLLGSWKAGRVRSWMLGLREHFRTRRNQAAEQWTASMHWKQSCRNQISFLLRPLSRNSRPRTSPRTMQHRPCVPRDTPVCCASPVRLDLSGSCLAPAGLAPADPRRSASPL